MKEQFLKILKSLTDGFETGASNSMKFNSGLSIENASKDDIASLKEAIIEFNTNSKTVKVKLCDPATMKYASFPTYMIEVYKEEK